MSILLSEVFISIWLKNDSSTNRVSSVNDFVLLTPGE